MKSDSKPPPGMKDDFEAFLTKSEMSGGGYKRHYETLRQENRELHKLIAKLIAKKKSARPRKHMVIGDPHASPGISNDRFKWFGKMAAEERPDVIVSMGDWSEMESLCSYDKGKKSFEGRRYWKDVEASVDAREKFSNEIAKARGYKPELEETEGNHEDRINRATDENPALDGLISPKDLKAADYGWNVHPFLVPVVIDGIAYVHYAPSGVKVRPIGGINHAVSLLRLCGMSTVVGHAHTYDYSEFTRIDGQKSMAISAGCGFEHYMPWAGPANAMYFRGALIIDDVVDGFGQVEKISLAAIKRRYS